MALGWVFVFGHGGARGAGTVRAAGCDVGAGMDECCRGCVRALCLVMHARKGAVVVRGLVSRWVTVAAAGALAATVGVPAAMAAPVASSTAAPAPVAQAVAAVAPAATREYGPVDSTYGQRTGTGCVDDGQSGRRVQVVYATSSDRPDRLAQMMPTIQERLRFVDDTFVWSSKRNGIPAGGTARQVRWAHGPDCVPTVIKALVDPVRDTDGTLKRVETEPFGPSMQMVTAWGKANNVDLLRSDRKYVVLVDDQWLGSRVCGEADQPDDTNPLSNNGANWGPHFARMGGYCWVWDAIDSQNRQWGSGIAHELMHTLGAVNPAAKHYDAAEGHCTDNADLMCYGKAAQRVCPDAEEWLLDCGGDDYFNTKPLSGNDLYTRWNTADSLFLYSPQAPALTQSVTGFVPGLPMKHSLTPSIPSGMGWKATARIYDWAPAPVTDGVVRCSVATTARFQSGQDPTWSPQCMADTTRVVLRAGLEQEDGRGTGELSSGTITYTGNTRPVTTTVTVPASVPAGSATTVTVTVKDQATGQGVYGMPVTVDTPSGQLNGRTDTTGVAALPYTATTSGTLTATTPLLPAWQASTAGAASTVVAATRLTLDPAPSSVLSGTSVTFTGALTAAADGAALTGQPVTLWQRTGTTWAQAASSTTTTGGKVSLTAKVTTDATYELRYAGTASYGASTSGQVALSTSYTSQLTAGLSAPVVTLGEEATLTAVLKSGATPAPVAGVTVTLEARTGTGAWAVDAEGTTDAAGSVRFQVAPEVATDYRAVFAGSGRATAVTSAVAALAVRPAGTLTLTGPRSLAAGADATWTAQLGGAGSLAGRTVYLEDVWENGSRVLLAQGVTDATGKVTLTLGSVLPGTMNVRAYTLDANDLGAARSTFLPLTVVAGTTLTLDLATSVREGDSANAVATLTGPAGPLNGVTAVLTRNGTAIGSVVTDPDGVATFALTPKITATYQVTFAGDGDQAQASSPARTLRVDRAVQLKVTKTPGTATYGQTSTWSATLTRPVSLTPVASHPVALWRVERTGSTQVARGFTDALGNITLSAPITVAGTYELRAEAKAVPAEEYGPANETVYVTGTTAGSASLAVARATAVSLSAPASAAAGTVALSSALVTWSGTDTPVAGVRVRLQRLSGSAWLDVSTVTTGSDGKATFAVPMSSTTSFRAVADAGEATPWRALGSISSPKTTTVSRATSSRVTLSGSTVTYGSTRTVTASVTAAGSSSRLTAARMELVASVNGGAWKVVAARDTDSKGYAAFTVKPSLRTAYRVVHSGGKATSSGTTTKSTSSTATLKVVSGISLKVPSSVRSTSTYTLTGSVSPAKANRTVTLYVDGKKKATTKTNSKGAYSFRYKFPRGYRYVKTYVAGYSGIESAYSQQYRTRSS